MRAAGLSLQSRNPSTVHRRTFLAAAGTIGITGIAGCQGGGDRSAATPTERTPTATSEPAGAPFNHHGTIDEPLATNGDFPADETPSDGRPPAFSDPPAAPDVEASALETLDVNGETVRLAPIDDVEAWYYRGTARFVDARGLDQYALAHVYGSVSSPAQPGSTGGGINGWATDDRVVTYCGCPHHLSSIRAAGLQRAGFSRVYAIDEGFGPWVERENPMAGTAFEDSERAAVDPAWTLDGAVDPRHAGAYVWASAGRQAEAAPIQDDGRFTLAVRFPSATAETPVSVTTPSFELTRPLGELASVHIDRTLATAGTSRR